MPNELCQCPQGEAGFCDRHQMYKGILKKQHCYGVSDTRTCGMCYWNRWEKGLNGATAPEDPQLNPPGFCQGIIPLRTNFLQSTTPSRKSSIGDKLHNIIEREEGVVACPDCLLEMERLNGLTQEQAIEDRPNIVAGLLERAEIIAPKLWQRWAVKVDKKLGTGKLVSGTRSLVGIEGIVEKLERWVDEAIETGGEPSKQVSQKPSSGCKGC